MRLMTSEQQAAFVATCRRAEAHGLLMHSSGNLSWRFDDEHVALTASRVWLGDMTETHIVVCRLADGQVLEGGKPSVESRFHLGILQARRDVDTVLHFQSPAATAMACIDCSTTNFHVIPEIPYYVGRVGVIPFWLPGSEELSRAVVHAMTKHNLVILRNHGLVVVGRGGRDALQKAGFFELACSILVQAADVQCLNRAAVAEIIEQARQNQARPMFPDEAECAPCVYPKELS